MENMVYLLVKIIVKIFIIMDSIIHHIYPTPAPSPTPTPATVFHFNGIDNELLGIDILECIFGIRLCENGFVNGINEICSGMF